MNGSQTDRVYVNKSPLRTGGNVFKESNQITRLVKKQGRKMYEVSLAKKEIEQ